MATANKFGLRKAAAERSKKHSQRTPLPPREGQIEDAREVIAEFADDDETLPPARRTALATRQPAVVDGDASDTKSLGKAQAFGEKARAAKWEVSIAPSGSGVELTATRGAETIVQAWRNGVWEWPTSFYGHGDRTTKPRNASGAVKLLERTPEDAAAEAGKVASNKHFRKAEPKDLLVKLEEAQRMLPFDPGSAPDEIILATLTGQSVVWYNRLSRGQESATVGRKGPRMSVAPDGERIVTFCCPTTGYRSLRVSAILRVGRGRSSSESAVALVEVS